MRLEFVKGKESSIITDDVQKTLDNHDFWETSYKNTFKALEEYKELTQDLRGNYTKESSTFKQNNIIFQSPQNIFVFAGERGSGKTSMLFSILDYLDSSKERTHLQALQPVILNPIDPTMLENNQNILNAVLSRLFLKTQEQWGNRIHTCNYRNAESEKNELLSKIKQCQEGITATKSGATISNLTDLQKMGDSSILKKNFYDLIELVNNFCLPNQKKEDRYLIIPIDDQDCQISKCFDILEDLRRYLTLPNVIIIMSTDTERLKNDISERYLAEYDDSLKHKMIDSTKIHYYTEKYIAKLIPPSHKIYLPSFEKELCNIAGNLELYFYDCADKTKELIGLSGIPEKAVNFDAKIVNYIFKKTHLVFNTHNSYLNNIIPTTMRGMAYLLNELGKMEDVPEIDYKKKYSKRELTALLRKQNSVLLKNVRQFETFFLKEWVPVKLNSEMIEIVNDLADQVPEKRITFISNAVKKYADCHEKYLSILNGEDTYMLLDYRLRDYTGMLTPNKEDMNKGNAIDMEDYYFAFAIRTILSIENTKDLLLLRQEKVNHWNQKNHLLFDYKSYTGSLATHIVFGDAEVPSKLEKQDFCKKLLDSLVSINEDKKTQLPILAHEDLAAIILSNMEVQEAIRKIVVNANLKSSDDNFSKSLLEKVREGLKQKNDCMLKGYFVGTPFQEDKLKNIKETTTSEKKDEKALVENIRKKLESANWSQIDTSVNKKMLANSLKEIIDILKQLSELKNNTVKMENIKDLVQELETGISKLDSEDSNYTENEFNTLIAKVTDTIVSV